MRYVGLLRGVNVGGRTLRMSDLRTWIAEAGATDVSTYIQSGNVVFTHPARSAAALTGELEARLSDAAGFAVAVMLRTAAQWLGVLRANPFADRDLAKVHVGFCAEAPAAAAVAVVDAASAAPEELAVVGREVYLWLPNGVGRGELPTRLGRLRTPVTLRNWNTVTKLAHMVDAASA